MNNHHSNLPLESMVCEPLCFHNIIGHELTDEGKQIKDIIIPKLQRDYAYGRTEGKVPKKRSDFLESLKSALTGDPIQLDFIFGNVTDEGSLIPLDGQQRLTTLFLLYYFLGRHEGVDIKKEAKYLYHFSYDTRKSAADFCKKLIDFDPFAKPKDIKLPITLNDILLDSSGNRIDINLASTVIQDENKESDTTTTVLTISQKICREEWFLAEWLNDPTVNGMLVMLDDIEKFFHSSSGLWQELNKGKISFFFLPLDHTGLTDELYIKMNSRGKDLTEFENFKAEIKSVLGSTDEALADELLLDYDTKWTRLLWPRRGDEIIVDDMLKRYTQYLAAIVLYEKDNSQEPSDEWELIDVLFKVQLDPEEEETVESARDRVLKRQEEVKNNARKLIEYTDCWLSNNSRTEFELMLQCCRKYSPSKKSGSDSFHNEDVVRLYSFIIYLTNISKPGFSWMTTEEYKRRERILDHLLSFSADALSHQSQLPDLIKQTGELFTNPDLIKVLDGRSNSFQIRVQKEELEKYRDFRIESVEEATLFEIEDHPVFRGFLGILDFDALKQNTTLYRDNLLKILPLSAGTVSPACLINLSRVLHSISIDHSVPDGSQIRKYTCSNLASWQDLFSPLRKAEDTKELSKAFNSLLQKQGLDDAYLQQQIKSYEDNVIKVSQCFDIRYYIFHYYEYLDPEYFLLTHYKRKTTGRFANLLSFELDASHDRSVIDAYKPADNLFIIPTTDTLGGINIDLHLRAIQMILSGRGLAGLTPEEYAHNSYFTRGYCSLGLPDGYSLRNLVDKLQIMSSSRDDEGESVETLADELLIKQQNGCDNIDRIKEGVSFVINFSKKRGLNWISLD